MNTAWSANSQNVKNTFEHSIKSYEKIYDSKISKNTKRHSLSRKETGELSKLMFSKLLRVNVSKNRGKSKKCGHGQKIDFAHTLSV